MIDERNIKMNTIEEIYSVALDLERFASDGLKEGPKEQLREMVDRLRSAAKDLLTPKVTYN